MKLTLPREGQGKKTIMECLMETFNNRRSWINQNDPSISEIVDVYPRLLDFDGYMIELEYEAIMRSKGSKLDGEDFLGTFPTVFSPLINNYCKMHEIDIFERASIITKDDNLRALIMLAEILPNTNFSTGKREVKSKSNKGTSSSNTKKVDDLQDAQINLGANIQGMEKNHRIKSTIPNSDLLRVLPEGSNIESYIREVQKKKKEAVQPYIICIKGQAIDSYFVQGDGCIVQMHKNSNPINAFDMLFKFHFVFNVRYASSLRYLYNFIEFYLYKTTTTALSSVKSLNITLNRAQTITSQSNDIDDRESQNEI